MVTRFFHVPDNLGQTLIKYSADAELVAAINHLRPGAILMSDTYLDRLSPVILAAIEDKWVLMADIEHAHQKRISLYLPSGFELAQSQPVPVNKEFQNGVLLESAYFEPITHDFVLIETTWRTSQTINEEYKIQIQLLDESQNVIGETELDHMLEAQPVATWRPGGQVKNLQIIPLQFGSEQIDYHEVHIRFQNLQTDSLVDLVDGQGNFVSIPFSRQFVQR